MCSLRSWPVQNARPLPVSTTQRTAASSAACRTVSRSSSLVAMSRLFIASGRLRRIVADAVGHVVEDGPVIGVSVARSGAVMDGSVPVWPRSDEG